jgi:hypothetical protein
MEGQGLNALPNIVSLTGLHGKAYHNQGASFPQVAFLLSSYCIPLSECLTFWNEFVMHSTPVIKKTNSITFTHKHTCLSFLGQEEARHFHYVIVGWFFVITVNPDVVTGSDIFQKIFIIICSSEDIFID